MIMKWSVVTLVAAAFVQVPGGKLVEGKLTVGGRAYALTHAIAYERKSTGKIFQTTEVNGKVTSTYGEPLDGTVIVVLVANGPVTNQQAKALHSKDIRKESFIGHPYLELTIDKMTSEVIWFQGWADGTTFIAKYPDCAATKLRFQDGTVYGTAMNKETEAASANERFNFNYRIPLRQLGD